VSGASQFRFVPETGLLIKTLAGAAQRAAKNLLLCGDPLDADYSKRLEGLANAQPSYDCYEALAALAAIKELKVLESPRPRSSDAITRLLIEVVWHYTFMHFYWLKEGRQKAQRPE
jgi:hypothetical protein